MASKLDNNEDDSFIILGTSPGTSLDMKCNLENGAALDKVQLDDALKDLSGEASMAFKAHFKLGDCPSPASLMVASSIITDDKSTEELQKRFGELLDENVILKETLKQNNDSMKEQFLLIASCQEDMMKTHMLHKEKFDETRELVDKLRQENKKLKSDVARLVELEAQPAALEPGSDVTDSKSGPSSALEFVTSPDDDTIDKLTSQLELVEKQRRQVIVENEKLTWQKESLEHIVDATSKERDDLKEKLKKVELQISTLESDHARTVNMLEVTIQDLQNRLLSANTNVSSDEVTKRDAMIQQLEAKVSALQSDLKNAQLKILDLENVKLEFTKHKSGVTDTVKMYKDQIQELHNRLKEAQTTVFQPVRFSISSEPESSGSEYGSFIANVKLYDKALKHLAEMLNIVSNGSSDSLVQTLGVVASLQELKLQRGSVDQVKAALADVRTQLDRQHKAALNNIGQVRSTLTIFEGIFKDYNEILKKTVTKQVTKPPVNVEALTSALVARGQEITALQTEIIMLKTEKEDLELLKAQVELYKSDFEAERDARAQMASEKEDMLADFRTIQKSNQELIMQLEEVRKLNPNIFKSATAKRAPASAPEPPSAAPKGAAPRRANAAAATGNMVYTCPKCQRFSSDQYEAMEGHFDFCLDDF